MDPEQLTQARNAFLESVEAIRPDLHRYCARIVGSVLDGEDVVQEVLATAFFKISMLEDMDSVRSWLFAIAHNKSIDFLRRKKHPMESIDEPALNGMPEVEPVDLAVAQENVEAAFTEALTLLAPLERSCILLKDVFDYSLKEAAEITGTTVGSVKSALHRSRTKLREARATGGEPPPAGAEQDPSHRALLDRYVALFNARDIQGLKSLIAQDARLEIVGLFEGDGSVITDRYLTNYQRLPGNRKLAVGIVDGELVVIALSDESGKYRPVTAARVEIRDGRIARIRDYVHTAYILESAVEILVG